MVWPIQFIGCHVDQFCCQAIAMVGRQFPGVSSFLRLFVFLCIEVHAENQFGDRCPAIAEFDLIAVQVALNLNL